jgi:hypothetical protein
MKPKALQGHAYIILDTMKMFPTFDKAKPYTENIRGLNLVGVM